MCIFESEPIVLTEQQQKDYKRYKEVWLSRKLAHKEGFVDWGISNNIGDPYNVKEFLEHYEALKLFVIN